MTTAAQETHNTYATRYARKMVAKFEVDRELAITKKWKNHFANLSRQWREVLADRLSAC